MLLNNQEITEEMKEEIKKYLETNDKENKTIQKLWDAAKAVLRGKFTATDKSSPQKINKETLELNHTLDQMDLTDTHRIFHPSAPE